MTLIWFYCFWSGQTRVSKDRFLNCGSIFLMFLTQGPCSEMVIYDFDILSSTTLWSLGSIWNLTEILLPGVKVVPSNLNRILMGFRRLLNVQYFEDCQNHPGLTESFHDLGGLMMGLNLPHGGQFLVCLANGDSKGIVDSTLFPKRTNTRNSCTILFCSFPV